jgi:AcrR family transcriptional regulator
MKSTFERLNIKKKTRIIQSCIDEFGLYGYDHCSIDRIIQNAGISKGGLYEYIDSKDELYIYVVSYCFDSLYDYIEAYFKKSSGNLPLDILDRFRIVSNIAIDFYIDHPEMIAFIVKCNYLSNQLLHKKVQDIFLQRFLRIFGSGQGNDSLAFDYQPLLELLQWLLIKTRNDFLLQLESAENKLSVRDAYLRQWEFYFSILRNGIYKTGTSCMFVDSPKDSS